jgi:3-hydroxyisobutyrate dehydrogenase-like beta-hydroxyacid dehydrogenase
MGKNIVHCGGAGAGEITKLCNNLSLAISMIGTSEAMALVSLVTLDRLLHLSHKSVSGYSFGDGSSEACKCYQYIYWAVRISSFN